MQVVSGIVSGEEEAMSFRAGLARVDQSTRLTFNTQGDGHRSEEFAGRGILSSMIDLFPKGEAVKGTTVGTEGRSSHPVKHQERNLQVQSQALASASNKID